MENWEMTHKQLNCIMEFLIHLPRTSLFFEKGLWVFQKQAKGQFTCGSFIGNAQD